MEKNRKELYRKLEDLRGGKLILYFTGDKRNFATQISSDAFDYFVNHLDKMEKQKKIILYLYTRGGDTLAGWSIINLIRQFCDELEIIIPSKARSTGTLMALGANNILMTKQATLGPIDPSVNGPLNPIILDEPSPYNRYPVSVEAIKGFIELVKDEFGIKNEIALSNIFMKLSSDVHPLVLGDVYRARMQIKMLAKRLIKYQIDDVNKQDEIINFLSSEAGSHDYTIDRDEARKLGLKVEKPNDEEYEVIKSIYDSVSNELELNDPFIPNIVLGDDDEKFYSITRIIIESINYGKDIYYTKGVLKRENNKIQEIRINEGWQHE